MAGEPAAGKWFRISFIYDNRKFVKRYIYHIKEDYTEAAKMVISFQTHGGWPCYVLEDIKIICFAHEKAIRFDSAGGDKLVTTEEQINKWIEMI